MTTLRRRMIEDMTLAGLSRCTQRTYLYAIRGLAAFFGRSPEILSEAEVSSYLHYLIMKRVARGTFQATRFAILFLYANTLQKNWPLLKKSSAYPNRNGSLKCWTMTAFAV